MRDAWLRVTAGTLEDMVRHEPAALASGIAALGAIERLAAAGLAVLRLPGGRTLKFIVTRTSLNGPSRIEVTGPVPGF